MAILKKKTFAHVGLFTFSSCCSLLKLKSEILAVDWQHLLDAQFCGCLHKLMNMFSAATFPFMVIYHYYFWNRFSQSFPFLILCFYKWYLIFKKKSKIPQCAHLSTVCSKCTTGIIDILEPSVKYI